MMLRKSLVVAGLLALPLTVTITGPVVAPSGTTQTIWVSAHDEIPAVVPLKVTVLVPCAEPKFAPAMVTEAPDNPRAGYMDVMEGVKPLDTVKSMPLD